ncbi:MAG: hypothetical protein B7Y51_03315 [Burkholderiales bacterium 28-67-8]|nr:MAG: hypothetical protein B7Y51_03315 [Burkholderiales bacterium 28-67-8]
MIRFGDGTNWLFKQDYGTSDCSNAYFAYWGAMKITECQVFTPAVATNPVAQPGNMPAIDITKIPFTNPGFSDIRLRPTTQVVQASPDGTGNFRDKCALSHMAFNDPLVFPGQPGASHLHMFFGNTSTDAFSTVDSLTSSGNSSCNGGIMNRTAYWVPAVIDTSTGTPLEPGLVLFYYKSSGIDPSKIQPLPVGLRMFAGNPKATSESTASGRFSCENVPVGVPKPPTAYSIPNCPVGSKLFVNINFPRCWDGVNLDSPDHRSHMAYQQGNACPSTHPVAIPEVAYELIYPIKVANAPLLWRLSSDNYDTSSPGGYSMHGDWMNGWNKDLMNIWLKNCVQSGSDCHADLLGDGRQYYGY